MPPPRRKSSSSTVLAADNNLNVPLAQSEASLSAASTQDLNQIQTESFNDLSTQNASPINSNEQNNAIVLNIRSTENPNNFIENQCNVETPILQQENNTILASGLQITPEVMQEIIERVRETLPIQQVTAPIAVLSQETTTTKEKDANVEKDSEQIVKTTSETNEQQKETEDAPKRPPTPTDYTLLSDIPASFYRLRTGISEEESALSIPTQTQTTQKHRFVHFSFVSSCCKINVYFFGIFFPQKLDHGNTHVVVNLHQMKMNVIEDTIIIHIDTMHVPKNHPHQQIQLAI